MAIGNGSGRDVEYEVQPPDPGGNLTAPITTAMLFTAAGGAFTAFGCLGRGGTTITVVGLFLLAAALVAEAVALNRARSASSLSSAGGGAKTLIADGAEHPHTFTAGTWVVFHEVGQDGLIAQSPIIFDADCTVVLRQCPPPQDRALLADAKMFVEVIPSAT